MYWMLASAGLNFLGGELNAQAQRKTQWANYRLDLANQDLQNTLNLAQSEKSYNQALKVTNNQLQEITAANDAQIEANTKNTLAAHYKAGLVQIQQGMANKQQVADRETMRRTSIQALGAVNANAAASGTIGSSVDAVAQDIERTMGEALVQADERWDIQSLNYKTQLYDLYTGLDNMLKSGISANGVMDPTRDIVVQQNSVQMPNIPSTGAIALGALGQAFGGYAMARMNLGLGGGGAASDGNLTGGSLRGASWGQSYSLR